MSMTTAKAKVAKQRDKLKAQIQQEEDDPIAPYERYVSWLLEQDEDEPFLYDLEIILALEESIRTFKDDKGYRDDLRYAKLWLQYAQRIEKPDVIYVYMLKANIGCIHAQLYDDYATSLETQNRFREAEEAYRLGISRSNRGADRLKKRYREFQQRVVSKTTLESKRRPPVIPSEDAASLGAKLYRNPLRNIITKRNSSNTKTKSPPATGTHEAGPPSTVPALAPRADSDPYSYMKAAVNAPPVPGKKVEKYRFDLSLLFKEGKEYCIQEARAASLGLLGKKWGPPPSEASSSKEAQVGLNDDGARPATRTNMLKMTTNMTAQLAMEPTVTINTKEALRDVFGMYNSPERTLKMTQVAIGSKHAPVRKLEPLLASQSRNNLKKITELAGDEERPSAAFQPFVDEETKKENAPLPKFKPFVDENASTPAPRPGGGLRRALSSKAILSSSSPSEQVSPENIVVTPVEEEKPVLPASQPRSIFSKVFTPQADRTQPEKPSQTPLQVFRDTDGQSSGSTTPGSGLFGAKVFSKPPEKKSPQQQSQPREPLTSSASLPKVLPLGEGKHEPVFRRSASTPQRSAFTPVSKTRQPLAFAPQRPQHSANPEPEPEPYSESQEPELDEASEEGEEEEPVEDDFVEEDYQDGDYYGETPAPLGGRFGQFGVMTPIAERTFECTMTTRTMLNTPSKTIGNGNFLEKELPSERAAAFAAEELAQELEKEAEDDFDEEPEDDSQSVEDANDIVEMTGTLSLADAIAAASSFRPHNPCNPADPKIVNALLSMVPPEPDFADLRTEDLGQFESLQSFAKKKSRRGSTKSVSSIDQSTYQLRLPGCDLLLENKLGEGGFGIVFEARVKAAIDDADDSMELDDDDDEDNFVAVKVVKPRNIWEFHVLRRIHAALPAHMRSSVIEPRALYVFRDESYLILDLCTQGTLLDIVNHAADAGVSQQGACLDELLVMFFTIELFKFIESMHEIGFIHGDLKIDNCLLRLEEVPGGSNAWSGMYHTNGDGGWRYKGIKMIDFGRAIDTRMYPHGQRFIADWKTSECDCLQLRENRPWTYEVDYFGLASIVHCMLFGKYFDSKSVVPVSDDAPVRYRIAAQLKRYWQVDIWTRVFDLLLNPLLVRGDGSLPLVPELGALRGEMETWLESSCNRGTNTLRGLLKKVERSVL